MLNVQADIRQRLENALGGVEVRVSVPADRPAELVTVTRIGGHPINALQDDAQLGVMCWAATEQRAWELANAVNAAMLELRAHGFAAGYSDVTCDSMRSFADPDEPKQPRWFASYTLRTHDAITND